MKNITKLICDEDKLDSMWGCMLDPIEEQPWQVTRKSIRDSIRDSIDSVHSSTWHSVREECGGWYI